MANYPQYTYQPQQMGYQPQMQPMYQQYQQPMQNQQLLQQEQFFCRPVASEEEGRGIPVDFSGKPMFFPHLNAGRIYVKMFDPNSGSVIFCRFRKEEEPAKEAASPAVAFAPMSEVEQLRQMVTEMQSELRAMKASKRKNTQEVALNDE